MAIRIIEMKNMEDEAALEAFRSDVATFTKTRHENVVLFMGSSQQLTKIDRKLAIVTSLCKGSISSAIWFKASLSKFLFPFQVNPCIIICIFERTTYR